MSDDLLMLSERRGVAVGDSESGGSLQIPADQTIRGRLYLKDRHFPDDDPLVIVATGGGRAAFDGNYEYPKGKLATTTLPSGVKQSSDRAFIAHDGKEHKALGYVWGGLIHIKNCTNVRVIDVDITQSRGGGLVIEDSKRIKYIGGAITHSRHAAIRVIRSHDVELAPSLVHENANFARVSRRASEMNWPVIVNVTHDSTNVVLRDAWIWGNWGEGVGSGQRIKNLKWQRLAIGPNLACGAYMHEGEDVTMEDCILYHDQSDTYNRGSRPSSLLVVNREMNIAKGDSDRHLIRRSVFLPRSDSFAIDLWGNQGSGKTGALRIADNVAVSKAGYLLRSIGNIARAHTDTAIFDNMFGRLDGGDCYTDRNDGKSPIDGETVRFMRNVWSKLPPASMRGEGDTVATSEFDGMLLAEGVQPGERPRLEDYVIRPSAPSLINEAAALVKRLTGDLGKLSDILARVER